jgi:hypothetical protein
LASGRRPSRSSNSITASATRLEMETVPADPVYPERYCEILARDLGAEKAE